MLVIEDGFRVLANLVLLGGKKLDCFIVEKRVDGSRLHCVVQSVRLSAISSSPVRHENGGVNITHHCCGNDKSKVNVEFACQDYARDGNVDQAG